jgi:hypothetical protein
MENLESLIKLVSAGVLLIAYIVVVIANIVQYRKLRRELGEVKIIVKDTNEIREALKKPLEGTWAISGEFSKYKAQQLKHYTTGHAIFSWNPKNLRYDILYMYSVRAEKQVEDVITCFCSGHASSDKNGNVKNGTLLQLNLKIDSRTAKPAYGNELTKSFTMTAEKIVNPNADNINNLSFNHVNDETSGKIHFTK